MVGTSNRGVHIYDLRKMNKPIQIRESSLLHQTRKIKCLLDNTGFILSSTDGRIAVEYFDLNENIQAKKYAFKCHRKTDKNTKIQTIYPVNSLAINPIYGTFASGGCDGIINIWDGINRKRLCQYAPYHTSIASMSFHNDGMNLAIAVSYTFEKDELPNKPEEKK